MESLKIIDTKPIDLYDCFKAFVREDELGDEESWYVTYNQLLLFMCAVLTCQHDVCLGTVNSVRNIKRQPKAWKFGDFLPFW